MKDIDWKNLGFSYIKTDYRYIAHWKDGKWSKGELTKDNQLVLHEGSPALHYGQQCFEGLKPIAAKTVQLIYSVRMKMQNVCNAAVIVC